MGASSCAPSEIDGRSSEMDGRSSEMGRRSSEIARRSWSSASTSPPCCARPRLSPPHWPRRTPRCARTYHRPTPWPRSIPPASLAAFITPPTGRAGRAGVCVWPAGARAQLWRGRAPGARRAPRRAAAPRPLRRLQPYVQPYVQQAATLRAAGCNPMYRRLQPYVQEVRPLRRCGQSHSHSHLHSHPH